MLLKLGKQTSGMVTLCVMTVMVFLVDAWLLASHPNALYTITCSFDRGCTRYFHHRGGGGTIGPGWKPKSCFSWQGKHRFFLPLNGIASSLSEDTEGTSTLPTITIYNSKSRSKEVLHPVQPGKISLYTCGPTGEGRT